jgi:hypothetical protein
VHCIMGNSVLFGAIRLIDVQYDAVKPIPVAALLLACWNCGFTSHQGHDCLSLMSFVCCQVEVSVMS